VNFFVKILDVRTSLSGSVYFPKYLDVPTFLEHSVYTQTPSPITNVIIAAYTTAQAHLKLYEYLERLGKGYYIAIQTRAYM